MKITRLIIIVSLLFINLSCQNNKTTTDKQNGNEHSKSNSHKHPPDDNTNITSNHSHENESNHNHGKETKSQKIKSKMNDLWAEEIGRKQKKVEKPQNESKHDHLHENEEVARFSRNLFGEKLELFFESDVLFVGEKSQMIVHINTLSNFKPIKNGKLTVSLSNQKSSFRISTSKLSREGIFSIDIKPEKAGFYKLSFLYENKNIYESVEVENVIVYANEHDASDHSQEAENPHDISFLKEQMWKTDFETQEIKLKDFSQSINTIGEILPAQGEKFIISANTNGIALFSANNLIVGKSVKIGEELFIISGDVIGNENINVTYEKLKNEYEQCKIIYLRHEKLALEKIISSETLNESRKELISDSISYFNFLSNFSKKGVSINSQISGFVQNLLIEEGQYVTTGQPLAVVSAKQKMMIRADVPLRNYNLVYNISGAVFEFPYQDKTISLEQLNGKILSIGSSVQKNGKYIPVYFEVENDGSFIENAFVECFLKTGIVSNQIVIPKSALIEELGTFSVFIQTNGESFEKREIKTATKDGENVQVISGLNEGERIVTIGAMQIKLTSLSTGMDSHAGHNH
ncbi:MAG: efflux RND transporter periplasmic adaptor subunit [Bacteroidetes bacterium]|jgi:RND family efflux transporter MFP subunit|nr:efflux RND transporter periplasmic adaptor subunit [Bacteroidota bacterium]MBT6687548.1 efflux RND transporter periplasmic adaptor subunit [Bacteroidota bacterium]MBT7142779.1 efflux RND transporter periplasmic adaptor subunit [Bacteroidota bacterium]MBT7491982.1 efflux RND transporter periplasmic adaptor subunit [Bacteroidota bacterium]